MERIVAILLHLTFLGDGFLHLTLTLPSLLPDPKSGIVLCHNPLEHPFQRLTYLSLHL